MPTERPPVRRPLPQGALYKARYRITSVGLPPQESRDIEHVLRVGIGAQPVSDRPLALHGRLVERGVIAAREGAPDHAHVRLGAQLARIDSGGELALAGLSEGRAAWSGVTAPGG